MWIAVQGFALDCKKEYDSDISTEKSVSKTGSKVVTDEFLCSDQSSSQPQKTIYLNRIRMGYHKAKMFCYALGGELLLPQSEEGLKEVRTEML